MYIYIFRSICFPIFTNTYMCIYDIYAHTHTHKHIHTQTHTRTHKHTHTHKHTYAYVCWFVFIICMYKSHHIYTHIYVRAYIHTFAFVCVSLCQLYVRGGRAALLLPRTRTAPVCVYVDIFDVFVCIRADTHTHICVCTFNLTRTQCSHSYINTQNKPLSHTAIRRLTNIHVQNAHTQTHSKAKTKTYSNTHCAAVCCSVLQCVAMCCSVVQCVATCCSVLQCVAG